MSLLPCGKTRNGCCLLGLVLLTSAAAASEKLPTVYVDRSHQWLFAFGDPAYQVKVMAHELTHTITGPWPWVFNEGWASTMGMRIAAMLGYDKSAEQEHKRWRNQFEKADPTHDRLDIMSTERDGDMNRAHEAKAMWMIEQLESRFGPEFMSKVVAARWQRFPEGKPVRLAQTLDVFSEAAGTDLTAWYRSLGINGPVTPAAPIGSPPRAAGQRPTTDVARRLWRCMALFHQLGGFEGAVLVSRNDEVIYTDAFGWADREAKRPNTTDTVFALASVTKPLTATLIMCLVEEGKISLDKKVGEVLADFPKDIGEQITIRHLLSHTSGLPRDGDSKAASFVLGSAPGEKHAYSNLGFMVLERVVEQTTGQPFHRALRERVLKPAGMEHTFMAHELPEGCPVALLYASDGKLPGGQPRTFGACGGLCATVGDVGRWETALRTGKIVSPPLYREMLMPCTPNGQYGLGWQIGRQDDPGTDLFWHGGYYQGCRTRVMRFVNCGVTVVLLSNHVGYNSSGLGFEGLDDYAETLRRVAVGDPEHLVMRFDPQPLAATGAPPTDADFARLRGFSIDELHFNNILPKMDVLKDARIRSLHLDTTDLRDLTPLAGMPIEELSVHNSPLRTLEGIAELPHLQTLTIRNCPLSDLTALAERKLLSIALRSTRVTDLKPLAAAESLESLDVEDSPVSDLAPLKGKVLKELGLASTKVTDLSPLAGMPLTSLDLRHTEITDLIPSLGTHLEAIRLSACRVQLFAEPLKAMPKLKTINGCEAKDFWTRVKLLDHDGVGARVAVSSSSRTFDGEGPAVALVDGRLDTRWSSAYAEPQEVVVALDAPVLLERIVLHWESAAAHTYSLLTSLDGKAWSQVIAQAAAPEQDGERIDELLPAPHRARYLFLELTARARPEYGFSLYEIQVNGAEPEASDGKSVSTLTQPSAPSPSLDKAPKTVTMEALLGDAGKPTTGHRRAQENKTIDPVVGTWRRLNGQTLRLAADGTVPGKAGCRWECLDDEGRIYRLTWTQPVVYTVMLSDDGASFKGLNNLGQGIAANRIEEKPAQKPKPRSPRPRPARKARPWKKAPVPKPKPKPIPKPIKKAAGKPPVPASPAPVTKPPWQKAPSEAPTDASRSR